MTSPNLESIFTLANDVLSNLATSFAVRQACEDPASVAPRRPHISLSLSRYNLTSGFALDPTLLVPSGEILVNVIDHNRPIQLPLHLLQEAAEEIKVRRGKEIALYKTGKKAVLYRQMTGSQSW